jgi:hypothetical protein
MIALMLAVGIWRMTTDYGGGPTNVPAPLALAILLVAIGLCGLSVVPILLFRISDVTYLLFGALVLALALALLLLRLWPRSRKAPPDDEIST